MDPAEVNWPSSLPRLLWNRPDCPLCSSIEFREAEPHPLDGVLGLFALSPVRCVNCWRRYYRLAEGSTEKT